MDRRHAVESQQQAGGRKEAASMAEKWQETT